MALSVDPLRARFRCSTGLLGGEALSLRLSSALLDEPDRFIWRERIELGQVAAITRRLFAQMLNPSGDRIWTAVPEYSLI